MTDIMFRLSNLEILNKQIIEENNTSIQNLQGALEKEQKLKEKLHVKQDDNNEVLAKLHTTRQNISNMEKYNKGLENIKLERDSLQATLMKMDANYWKLETKKDSLSVE